MSGDQLDLFSGSDLRDIGMSLASEAQEDETPGWGERAYAAIVGIAKTQPTVHVDDLLREFREKPRHFNAYGAVWLRAIRDGVITRTGTARPTADRGKHAHVYPIYASNLYQDYRL